jgi:hypothetical protein
MKILIATIIAITSMTAQAFSSYKCFVKPFDQYPENRVNVLPTFNSVVVMHVESDRKTFKSKPKAFDIIKSKQIENMEAHGLGVDAFSVSSYPGDDGWHLGTYIKAEYKGKGGVIYECKKIRIVKD